MKSFALQLPFWLLKFVYAVKQLVYRRYFNLDGRQSLPQD